MLLREYKPADCAEMARLFYDTVHTVNLRDYTPEQVNAWATEKVDLAAWDASFRAHKTVIAEQNGEIIGFGDLDVKAGYLDRLYVHKDHQNEGVAAAICDALESVAETKTVTTHASLTAKGFFQKRDYAAIKEQQVERYGVWLMNFVMIKTI